MTSAVPCKYLIRSLGIGSLSFVPCECIGTDIFCRYLKPLQYSESVPWAIQTETYYIPTVEKAVRIWFDRPAVPCASFCVVVVFLLFLTLEALRWCAFTFRATLALTVVNIAVNIGHASRIHQL